MRRPLTILLCVCLSACGTEGGGSGSVQPAVEEVLATPSPTLVALPDGRLIVEVDATLSVIDPAHPELEAVVVGPASEIGRVYAAVRELDAILVLAEGGTFVLRGASWIPSPFEDALDGPIRGAARMATATGRGTGELWVLTEASLLRVTDGELERFSIEGSLAGAQLAAVGRPEGPALWLLLEDRLVEIWRDRTGVLRSARLILDVLPTEIAGDADGVGWMILDGELSSFGADRRLRGWGKTVERLTGSADSRELWAFGAEAFVHSGDTLYDVEGLTVGMDDGRAVGADGSLYLSDSASVSRVSPRRTVLVVGPEDGALLGATTRFEVVAEGMPTIEVELDGDSIEVGELGFDLDPMSLSDGAHELYVRVTYDDGTLPTEDRRSFEVVSNAGWTDHVGPIYEAQCAACHGPEGPANTRLDAPEDWQGERAEQILVNVTDGRMPLGRAPLSQREIALIQAWMVNGFAP